MAISARTMTSDLPLRRKWTLRAHGSQVVLVKKPYESSEHVLMKALLWALYLPAYPDLTVEVPVGDRYKPDLVALDGQGRPRFWAEAGQVTTAKIHSLMRRYRGTHFALAKWDTSLKPYLDIVRNAHHGLRTSASFDIIRFPSDSADRFIREDGTICVSHDDLTWMQLP